MCFLISFHSSPKKINQIKNNVVCVVSRLVSVYCCALTAGHCSVFQHIFRKSKEIRVLRLIFPDYIISCENKDFRLCLLILLLRHVKFILA